MATLSFSDIQDRVDTLYAKDLFQPNAFYPTTMVMEVPPDEHSNKLTESSFKSIKPKRKDKALDMADFLLYFVNGGAFVEGAVLQPKHQKTLDNFIEMEDTFKKDSDENRQFDYANLDRLIPYLLSVEGLNTPKLPYVKKNGRLTVEAFSGASNCTLKFLASKEGEVLQNLLAWQSHWATYDFEKRSVASAFNRVGGDPKFEKPSGDTGDLPVEKDTESFSVEKGSTSSTQETYTKDGEVYLGLDYLNIKPDGTTERVGHLFMFGLIPVQIKPSWSGYGPQASTSGVPTLEVSCIYSHAFLGMPIKQDSQRNYHGNSSKPNVRFLVYE